jgi:hypothetical protein
VKTGFGLNLEEQLQPELDLPGQEALCRQPELRRVSPELVVWLIQIGPVEDVEALGAELEAGPLIDLDVLEQRKVDFPEVWSPEDIAAQVAVKGNEARRGIGLRAARAPQRNSPAVKFRLG